MNLMLNRAAEHNAWRQKTFKTILRLISMEGEVLQNAVARTTMRLLAIDG